MLEKNVDLALRWFFRYLKKSAITVKPESYSVNKPQYYQQNSVYNTQFYLCKVV